jgi:hypothetical protein
VPTRLSNTFRLDLLGVEAALQAIQLPAIGAGVKFLDPAARKLVDDLRQVLVQRPDGEMEPQPACGITSLRVIGKLRLRM